jgi:hypothetical protein
MSEANTDTTVSPSGDATPTGHGGDAAHVGSGVSPQASPDGLSPAPREIATDVDYLTGLETAENRPFFDHSAKTMRMAGVEKQQGNQLLHWMGELDGASVPPNEQPVHKYDIERYQHKFADEDLPYLHAYLNRAHAADWTQAQVERALAWYQASVYPMIAADRAEEYRETEKLDRAERKETERALRIEWGMSYDMNLRVINEYFASLPADERSRMKAEALPDGRLALNHPDKLRELLKIASAPKTGKSRAERLSELRDLMRKDRRKWNSSEQLQAEYRSLLAG